MADEKTTEGGVYGENVGEGSIADERGVREETVEAHPQPTGDAAADAGGVDAADDVRARGAEAIEGSEGTPEEDMDRVRAGQAIDAGSGGGGRTETPRNANDAPQGEFPRGEDDRTTPG